MSEMSQAQSQTGGDPLDLTGAVGTDPDVLPGPPGGADVGDEGRDIPSAESGPVAESDPAPESGATLDPPRSDAVSDPLDDDAEGIRTLGIADSGATSDPMPDMSGTSD